MLTGMLQTLSQRPRRPASLRPAPHAARLFVEELETRTTPSAASIFTPLAHLATDVSHDITNVQSVVQGLTQSLSSSPIAAVTTDLGNLTNSLNSVVADISGGASFANDLSALFAAQAQLTTDLGSAITTSVQQQLNSLSSSLIDLRSDLNQISQGLSSSVQDIQSDLSALMNAVTSSSTSATISADLSALNTALNAVVAASASGQIPSADITSLMNALTTLTTDLGANVSSAVQHALNNFSQNLTDLQSDLTQVSQDVTNDVSDIQSDATAIVNRLGSMNVSATVSADITAMNAALAVVVSHSGGGSVSVSDVETALAAVRQLGSDLHSDLSGGLQHQIQDLRSDLMDLRQDVGGIARDIRHDVMRLVANVKSLVGAVAPMQVSATVTADVGALQTAVSKVVADLAAGQINLSDINAAIAADAQVQSDLVGNVSPALRRLVTALRSDLMRLLGNVTQISNVVSANVANIQQEVQSLLAAIGTTNLSAAATADITALNNAVAAVASASASGQLITSQINAVVGALNTLAADLGSTITSAEQQIISGLQSNLTALVVELLPLHI